MRVIVFYLLLWPFFEFLTAIGRPIGLLLLELLCICQLLSHSPEEFLLVCLKPLRYCGCTRLTMLDYWA